MSNARATRRFPIIACIVASLTLAIAPLPEWAEAFRPDWVALTMIYWAMMMPRTYSVGSAWLVGLILDVAQGTLFGQHALAISLVVYITVKFHLQLRVFPLPQTTLIICGMLSLYQFLLFWINGVAGINSHAVTYWGPVITSTLMWPILSMTFSNIRDQARSRS